MPRAGVSVTPGRTYRGDEDPETGEYRRPVERRTSRATSERTARLPRDGAGRAIRPPHVRLASMADVTAELDFTPGRAPAALRGQPSRGQSPRRAQPQNLGLGPPPLAPRERRAPGDFAPRRRH